MVSTFFSWLNSAHIAFQSVELSKAFIVFILFSTIGWICEVVYVGLFFEHKFVNRGFLFGPLCPIYGVGGILILMLPQRLHNPVWLLFITGMVFCSLVEYAGSLVLEKMFHTKWWDYSNKKIIIKGRTVPLNINGRICFQNSVLFGIMTVSVLKFAQPLIEKILDNFSNIYIIAAANILLMFFIIDLSISITKMIDFSVHIAKLKEFGESLKDRYQTESWFRSGSLSEMFESIKERSLQEKEKFSSSLLQKIESANMRHRLAESFISRFPTMKSNLYKDSLVHLKQRIKDSMKDKLGRK